MPDDDARLTDFTGGSDADEGDEGADPEDGASADQGGAVDGEVADEEASVPADPPSTAAWTPGGAECETCGSDAERRWRDGEAWVCGDCKDW